VESLARLIGEYAAAPQLRDTHARAARRVAVERFALNTMVEQYHAIYAALCYGDRECPA
jgi:glycosyltransferase involved in cell wall biosynthesis